MASIVLAWNPGRPGALVPDVGKLMIVDESIRAFSNFAVVSHVGKTIAETEKELKLVKTQMFTKQ